MATSTTSPGDLMAPGRIDRALMVCGLIAFLALLGAYTALRLAGQDPSDLLRLLANLAGIGTVGAGVSARVSSVERRLAPRIDKLERTTTQTAQDTATVKRQTNGANDERVQRLAYDAMVQALQDHQAGDTS